MFLRAKYNLAMIDHTSKMSLKMSCLKASGDDIDKARKLYEFLSADIAELPDVDPIIPGTLEQIKQSATEAIGWVSSHRDDIAQGISFLQALRKPTASTMTAVDNIPPIPKI